MPHQESPSSPSVTRLSEWSPPHLGVWMQMGCPWPRGGGKERFHVETFPCSPCWDVLKVKMCSKLACRVVVVGVGVVGAGGLGTGVNTSRAQVLAGSEAGILEVPSIMLRGD